MGRMLRLIGSMLKIGAIGFGGGNALIPVIHREVVEEKKLITKEEYEKDIIAATLTPGALPVEIASGIGKKVCGKKGMIIGGITMAAPGVLATVLLLAAMNLVNAEVLLQIQYASIGITAFIMCLLTEYITNTFRTYKGRKSVQWKAWAICLGVFLLTCGKNLYKILHIDRTPIFSVSTIDMLAIAFFCILVTDCKFTWQNMTPALIISGIYLLSVGKAGIIHNNYVTWTIRGVMVLMSIYCLYKSNKSERSVKKKIRLKPLVVETLAWICFILVFAIPAFVFVGAATGEFGARGLFSSVISFGGGDAYLTIADGLFIPGYITEDNYYNNLVLIVNVLPGSILCKTLSGVGYAFGLTLGKSIIAGLAMALVGFVCSVAASCGVFGVIYHLYEYLESVEIFINIKKCIRVIVSGMLLTVMTGLINTSMKIGQSSDHPWFIVILMIAGIYGLNIFLIRKANCQNVVRIGVSLVLSMGLCNAFGI